MVQANRVRICFVNAFSTIGMSYGKKKIECSGNGGFGKDKLVCMSLTV